VASFRAVHMIPLGEGSAVDVRQTKNDCQVRHTETAGIGVF